MSYPRPPTTTTSAATTTPNATPNEPYDASPGTPTVWATPSVSTPSKPHNSPNAASLTAIFDAGDDTSANVVLLSDAPTHVTARGQSHRRDREAAVPESGDRRLPVSSVTLAASCHVGWCVRQQDDIGAGVVPCVENSGE